MMRRLSVRARITIGSLLVAATLLAIGLLVVRQQVDAILTNADVQLAQDDLVGFQHDIIATPTAEVDDPGTGVLVYVRDPSGKVNVNTLPHDVLIRITGRQPSDSEFRMTDDEGRDFVVVSRSVSTSAGVWAMWSARNTSASELAEHGFDSVLLVGGVVLLLGFGAASWLLATVALRPVARMRRRASSLGETLDGELPVGRADDELAALATTLNELLARVRSASVREKQMVSDAAHELRTPLASLTTQLELAHRDRGNAEALGAHLDGVQSSVARLSALATKLLELNRLETQGVVTPADTSELVTELMSAVDRARLVALGRAGSVPAIDVGFELRDTEPSRRYALDAQGFGRIADNLLTNAINAVPAGGRVDAVLEQTLGGLTLTVRDDGPGMPDEFLPHAFERFSRPDTARAAANGGSGLGLALVRAIVVAADGEVFVHNTRPGFEVVVRLPNI